MTEPSPSASPPKRTFFDRKFAPLVTAWVAAIIVAGLIYWFERAMPAFDEVVAPLYGITALLIVAYTWRWIRTRGKIDRRHHMDRRRTDRRNTAEYSTKPPET